MADTAEPTAGTDEAPKPGTPTPADIAPKPQDKPETGTPDIDGLKSALDKERENAKNARAEFGAFKDAFAKALGLGGEKPLTTEELTAKVTEQTGRADTLERQLALERSLPGTVDKDALLDSAAFQKAISGVTPDKVAETVTSFVEQHPRFLRTNPGAGSRDLGEPTSSPTPTDPLVAALTKLSAR